MHTQILQALPAKLYSILYVFTVQTAKEHKISMSTCTVCFKILKVIFYYELYDPLIRKDDREGPHSLRHSHGSHKS